MSTGTDKSGPFPYQTETACYKKPINDVRDPSKNHPIHDMVERIEYGNGRYAVALALDGVSESKSEDKALVPVSRMLAWDLTRYCQAEAPENIADIAAWFHAAAHDPTYADKGNTTVACVRFDKATGRIDGFNVGDSLVVIAVDRLTPSDPGDEPELTCGAEVVAPLHSAANFPSLIYRGWRHGEPFEPDFFAPKLPADWVNAYLVTLTDGFEKISEETAAALYDLNEADRILARRFPHFAQVYLPAQLGPLVPGAERNANGRIPRAALTGRDDVWAAIAAYYDSEATPEERAELEVVTLDCAALYELIRKAGAPDAHVKGRPLADLYAESHRSLQWLAQARYLESEDESGIEDHLRTYVMGELFVEAMITEVFPPDAPATPITNRLRAFGESLGPIADDLGISLIRIQHRPPPQR